MSIYQTIRPLLFSLEAERAHSLGKGVLRAAGSVGPVRKALEAKYSYRDPRLEVSLFDMTFPSPVGIAAGFDKNAEMVHGLAALGFGFVEVGTVTPYPQPGNPRPRLFRLEEDDALINRLGFNSQGADVVRKRLRRGGMPSIPIGVNIGKMNDSNRAESIDDFQYALRTVHRFPDYFVVNVSCPNTPDEFGEQHPSYLHDLLTVLEEENKAEKPMLVKVGPDEDREALESLVTVLEDFDIDGVIATNTTTTRDGVRSPQQSEWGGLSGPPLEELSTDTIRDLAQLTDKPIIGVGGVRDATSAYRKIRAGASLVQLYTGFVYGGPSTAREINRGLIDRLHRDGFDNIEAAIGTGTKGGA